MPRRYKNVKKYTLKKNVRKNKTTTKKGYRKLTKTQRLPRQLFPAVKYYTTKLSFTYSLPATVIGTLNFDYLNIGSVYDPTGAAGGRQPVNTALMFQAYKYIQVLGALVKFTCMAPHNDTNPVIMCLTLQNDSIALPHMDEINDYYESNLRIAPVKMWGNYITKNLATNNYVTCSYSSRRYYRRSIVGEVDYSATESANPATFPRIGVYWTPPPGTAVNSSNMTFQVQIKYICCAWGPIMRDND